MPKKLSEVLKELNKKYGDGAISEVGEDDARGQVEWISTNCLSLDKIMGEGMPSGRIIEIYGSPSAGKSAIAHYLIAQIQARGGKAALIDAEFAFVAEYAKKLGVKVEELILSQPENGEMGLTMVEQLIKTGEVDIIVVDSTAALVPSIELTKDITETTIALQARMMSRALRMITGAISQTKTVVIFISQTRSNIGAFPGAEKNPSTSGNALKFYSSIRLRVDKIKSHKDKDGVVIGTRLKIEAVKNKVSLPFRSTEIDLYFEKGIDVAGDLFDIAVKNEIITKSGNTYSYGDLKLGVGRDNGRLILETDKKLFDEIKSKL